MSTNAPVSEPPGPDGRSELGDFRFVRKLGQGGMGEVFLAHQISLDRPAAVKVLAKHLVAKPDFVKRFYREARAMAKVDHPHAVRVFAVDEAEGVHYVAMEFVDGQSMQKWCDKLGALPVGDAIHVILRCAEALEQAHRINMVHRDIKPDNIMVTSRGVVKLSDFGLAKALDDDDMQMTQSGTGLGTPYYMAPEQARNAKHVDGRSDIYALGVTLYHFLTGKLPFTGSSAIEVIKNKELGRFTNARKLNPAVPEKLDLILDKMMAVKPEQRFKDMSEVIQHLRGLGLENPSLSFIDAPDKFVAAGAGAPKKAAASSAVSKAAASTAGGTAKAASSTTNTGSTAAATVMWTVECINAQGRKQVLNWSTQQILQALRMGAIDNRAKAKRRPNDPLLPLAQFPEFEKAVQSLLIKQRAEGSNRQAKVLLDSFQRQERWWKIKRKLRDMFSGALGLLSFGIYLAIVVGILYGAYWGWTNYGREYVDKLRAAPSPSAPSEAATNTK